MHYWKMIKRRMWNQCYGPNELRLWSPLTWSKSLILQMSLAVWSVCTSDGRALSSIISAPPKRPFKGWLVQCPFVARLQQSVTCLVRDKCYCRKENKEELNWIVSVANCRAISVVCQNFGRRLSPIFRAMWLVASTPWKASPDHFSLQSVQTSEWGIVLIQVDFNFLLF